MITLIHNDDLQKTGLLMYALEHGVFNRTDGMNTKEIYCLSVMKIFSLKHLGKITLCNVEF